ncbi:hypothetical protein RDI58_000056 [Solanum bulbocastanum]|uniref:Uncharacterized protein n=1 Tax=Solanum bulbocastanum TaxID=147425 RepID=A0AAN8YNS6_SOLBU
MIFMELQCLLYCKFFKEDPKNKNARYLITFQKKERARSFSSKDMNIWGLEIY